MEIDFKTRLKRLREEVIDITQEEMAKRLGVSRNYIALLEGGFKQPSNKIRYRVEFLERSGKTLEHREGIILNDPPEYFTDFDWLVNHGFGPELSAIAKSLRRVAEKQRETTRIEKASKQTSSVLDEATAKSLEKVAGNADEHIKSGHLPGAGAPSGDKSLPPRGVSKGASRKQSPPAEVPGGRGS